MEGKKNSWRVKRVKGCLIILGWSGRAAAVLCLVHMANAFAGGSSDLERILADLGTRKDELIGFRVSAVETNVTFSANHPAFEALSARPEIRKELERMRRAPDVGRTSIVSYVYSYQSDTSWMESVARDSLGKPVWVRKEVATEHETLSLLTFLDVPDAVINARNNATGELRVRDKAFLPGVPFFLGRGRLGEWLRDASDVKCSHAAGSSGENYYNLEVTTRPLAPPTPSLRFKLTLNASDLTPLEFSVYGPTGATDSRTQIEYGEYGSGLSLCRRATTQTLSGNRPYRQSVWELVSVEPEQHRETPTSASFFPLGATISDHRFSIPISYRLGTRPPTDAEIQLMLTNRTGVPLYEAATSPRRLARGFQARQTVLLVGALTILLVGPALMMRMKKSAGLR